MARTATFSKTDLQRDPWCILYLKVPRKADPDLLQHGYHAAAWCRKTLLERITPAAVHQDNARDIVRHSDIALGRMREIVTIMRSM